MSVLGRALAIIVVAVLIQACSPEREIASPSEVVSTPTLIVRGDRLFVAARINGVETTDALLDSGAEMSFLDKSFAEQVGLVTAGSETARGTGGEEEVTFAEGVTIEAAGLTLENQTVAVLDLSDISSRVVGYPVSIVVGREIFDAARLKVDIEASSIEAIARDADPVGVMLPMETHKGLQTIPASVEGGEPVQADFDLGNGNDVLIGADYAERVGLSAPERIVGQKAGGGIGGEVMRDMIVLRELEIAGVTFHDVPAAIDRTDTAADLNVGVRILRKFVITTDFSQNAVWLQER